MQRRVRFARPVLILPALKPLLPVNLTDIAHIKFGIKQHHLLQSQFLYHCAAHNLLHFCLSPIFLRCDSATTFIMADYNSMKVPELKKLLGERSLPHTGNKADLIARLTENDKQKAADSTAPPAGKLRFPSLTARIVLCDFCHTVPPSHIRRNKGRRSQPIASRYNCHPSIQMPNENPR